MVESACGDGEAVGFDFASIFKPDAAAVVERRLFRPVFGVEAGEAARLWTDFDELDLPESLVFEDGHSFESGGVVDSLEGWGRDVSELLGFRLAAACQDEDRRQNPPLHVSIVSEICCRVPASNWM